MSYSNVPIECDLIRIGSDELENVVVVDNDVDDDEHECDRSYEDERRSIVKVDDMRSIDDLRFFIFLYKIKKNSNYMEKQTHTHIEHIIC